MRGGRADRKHHSYVFSERRFIIVFCLVKGRQVLLCVCLSLYMGDCMRKLYLSIRLALDVVEVG